METITSGLIGIMQCSSCALRLGRKTDYCKTRKSSSNNNLFWSSLVIFSVVFSFTVHESSSQSTTATFTSNAEFINGLANSVRRIHSNQLAAISRNEPFLLQYRTACPSSNLIYNEKFSIHIDSDGNLSYTNKESNETQVFDQVADGHWHSLMFNGSTISMMNDDHHSTEEDENALTKDSTFLVTYSLVNPNGENSNSNSNNENSQHIELVHFFDGFVGCVRVQQHSLSSSTSATSFSSSSSSSSSTSHHPLSSESNTDDFDDGFEEFSQNSDHSSNGQQHHELNATASSIFQFVNAFPGCTDESLDLRNSHHCHIPDTFIYCEKCRGKCMEKSSGDQITKYNSCNCTNLNSRGRYCDIPITETAEPGRSLTEFNEPDSESAAAASTNNSNNNNNNNNSNNSNTSNTTRTSTIVTMARNGSSGGGASNSGGISNSVANELLDNSAASSSVTTSSPVVAPAPTPIAPSPSAPVVPCPCQNGGICANNQCYCTPGFTGDFCEIDIDECNPMKCRANSTVQCLNLINKFTCVCVPGFTSKLCDENIDECESNPCQNGANCVDGINNYTCSCLPGYTGMNCEIDIDECADDGGEPKCLNSGACIDKINGYDCNCTGTGFEGSKCQNNVDDCIPNACQHGSTCVDQIKTYTCSCFNGYTGYNCENDIKECEIPDPTKSHEGAIVTTSPCHEGTCHEYSNESLYDPSAWDNNIMPNEFKKEFSYSNASGYYCLCPPGFQGLQCEINLNECELADGRSPCVHGKCVDGRNNYTCTCDAGYTGRNCDQDIDECLSNPCVRGECVDKIADYECNCPEGFGSKNCSVKLTGCDPAPCLNQGSCRPYYENNEQQFSCTCQPGFSGQICSIVTTMSFNGSNYVTVASNDDNYRSAKYELQFRFKTTLSNVLVAVGQGITYFMLTLSDGRLNLQSSLLNSLSGISSGTNLSNAEWHKVWISVNDTHIALAANFEQTIHPISENQETPGDTGFNMTVLGGATPTLNSLNNQNLGFFVGCVQDVVINGQSVNTEEKNNNVTLVGGVKRGCSRKEQCKPANPCKNDGVCTDLWQKYQCHCTRPFLGSQCEFSYVPGTFGNENTSLSIAEVHISPEVSRKFSNSFDISMFVRTRESRGTIFFLGDESRENGIFLEAQVEEDGQLGVVSKLDSNLKEETYTVGGLQINDGVPHLINVQKEKGLVKISINGTEHFRKSVKEKVAFNPTIMFVGGFLPNSSDLVNDSNDFEDSTVIPGMEIPTKAPTPVISLRKMKPFKGVIQDVRVNLSSTDVAPTAASHDHFVVEFFPVEVPSDYSMGQGLGNVTLHGEVLEGVVSDETCVSNPCLNDGKCEVTWNDFQCHCLEGVYDGKTCEEKLRCAMVSCPVNSVCRNIGAVGFECVSEAAFDGRKNVSPHYHLKSQKIDHLIFQKISFRYRTRTGGSVIYMASRNASVRISLELEYEETIRDGNGEMMAANATDFVSVYLNGVRYPIKVENALDGDWHTIALEFDMDTHLVLKFDNSSKGRVAKDSVLTSNLFHDIVLHPEAQIIVGSHVRDGSQYEIFSGESSGSSSSGNGINRQGTNLVNHPESLHDSFYRGCLAEVKIGNYELPFVSPDQLYALNENRSLVETTAPTAFYIDQNQSPALTPLLGCVLCYDSECKNGGSCENASEKHNCLCNPGFDGLVCERNIDECIDNQCASGSTCVDLIANYTCNCPGGYTGWLCDQDLDECSNEINGNTGKKIRISPCKNGGQCINLPAEEGFYKCNCSQDYAGANCEKRKLSTCQNNNEPCENNSTCKPIPMRSDGLSFVCECKPGYEGLVCDKKIDFCKGVTCENGGTCNNIGVGFQCLCAPGWDGPKCDVDRNECAFGFAEGETSPCKHGVCIDGLNQFTCDCTDTGYTGENCEIDIDECANEETRLSCSDHNVERVCVNYPGGYSCECPQGTCGTLCNITNPCHLAAHFNDTCFNRGVCVPKCDEDPENPTFKCDCKEGFAGANCQELMGKQRDQTLSIALIVIPVLTAILLAVVIAIFVFIKMARKKRATRGVYSPSQQEYSNPRVELDNVMKPPPEERLI